MRALGVKMGLCPSRRIQGTTVDQWTAQDVSDWLRQLGPAYQAYVPAFVKNGIDGPLLRKLTEDDLIQDFGVDNKFHRQRIMRARSGTETVKEVVNAPGDAARAEVEEIQNQINGIQADNAILAIKSVERGEKNEYATAIVAHDGGQALQQVATTRFGVIEATLRHGSNTMIQVPSTVVLRLMDEVLNFTLMQRLPLDAAEAMNNTVLHNSACMGTGPETQSIAGISRQNATKFQRSQITVRESFTRIMGAKDQLAMATQSFIREAYQGFQAKGSQREIGYLVDALEEFKSAITEIKEAGSSMWEAMQKQAEKQFETFEAGVGAIKSSIEALKKNSAKFQKASREYQKLLDTPCDVNLRYAFEAREGILEGRIDNLKADIEALQNFVDELNSQVSQQTETIKATQDFILEQNKKKKHWRDWHIQRYWANAWENEMNVYDRQADALSEAQRSEGANAEKAKVDLELRIESCRAFIKKNQDSLQQMKYAEKNYESILTAAGVTGVETELQDAKDSMRSSEEVLKKAMRSVGVQDPEAAANAILMHHKVLMMIAESSRQGKQLVVAMSNMAAVFDGRLKRLRDQPSETEAQDFAQELLILPKGLQILGEVHAERSRWLEDKDMKVMMLRNYVESVMSTLGSEALENLGSGNSRLELT